MDFDVLLSELPVPSLSHVITLCRRRVSRNSMVLFIMQIFAYRTVNEIVPMFLNRAFFGICGVLIFSLIFSLPAVRAENVTPGVFPVDSKPYGFSIPEWTVKWWQWFLAIPQDNHPMNDETGKRCGVNQEDRNVWFLTTTGSGTAERTCTIPQGKAILTPVAANECSYAEFPNLKSEAELRNCAVSGNEVSTIAARVDGVEVKDIRKYRVQSPTV